MSILIIVVLIIIIINQEKKIQKIQEENRELKNKLEKITEGTKEKLSKVIEYYENFEEKNKENQTIKYENVEYKETINQYNISKEVYVRQEKRTKEQKNILVLITGAICIVLSAIIFLMYTWGVTSNILKTVVLGLLTVVFFKMSNIAKVKYKLEKASKAFYYMGMAYIPICLISISIFELFGRYLSIYGEGKIYILQ